MNVVLMVLSLPFLLGWLLFCLCLAVVGSFLNSRGLLINAIQVKEVMTICRVLNNKGLLTDEEYIFETEIVATRYDQETFLGYQFIVAPVVKILKHYRFYDSLFTFLVKRWMAVHRHWIYENARPQQWQILIAVTCVRLAQYLGRLLMRLGIQ